MTAKNRFTLFRFLAVCILWAILGFAVHAVFAVYATSGGKIAIDEMGVIQAGLFAPFIVAVCAFACVGPSLGPFCAGILFLLGFPASIKILLSSKTLARSIHGMIAVTISSSLGLVCVACIRENSECCRPSLSFFI